MASTEGQNLRKVWILARPLSLTQWLPALADTSDGRFHLCHWAILLTDANIAIRDIKAGLTEDPILMSSSANQSILGTLYELHRIGNSNTVNVISDFGPTHICNGWQRLSAMHIGMTSLKDAEISKKGDSQKLTRTEIMYSGRNY